jgi:hypothetical protein
MLSILIAHPVRVQHGLVKSLLIIASLFLPPIRVSQSMVSVSVRWSETATGICTASFFKVRMHASLLSGDTGCRIVGKHHFKEVEASWVEV